MQGLIVNIDVPDLGAATLFYQNGLGFDLRRTLFDGTVAELSVDSLLVYLIEQAEGTTPVRNTSIVRSYESHWTPVHLDILVEDIDVALAKALAAGAIQSADISVNDWGKLAPLRDPFGNGVCLLEFVGNGYDSVAD
jgi:predicted enzyme related to lactoylglutathione lyase